MPEGEVIELSRGDIENSERHIESQIERTHDVERSQAYRFLDTGRERYADARNKPNNMQIVADLIDYFGVQTDDVLDKKESNAKWKKEVKELSDMKQLVANSIVEGFDNHDEEFVNLRHYLEGQKENVGEIDRPMFEAFLDYLPHTATEAITAAPTKDEIESAQVTQEQLADFAYTPTHVNKLLMKLSRQEFAEAA